jgi:hypothetical protein
MPKSIHRLISVAATALAIAPSVQAKTEEAQALPPVVQAVADCRALGDSAQRLACYDRSVGAMMDAQAQRNLVVADRTKVVDTQRKLFGTYADGTDLFGAVKLDRIEAKVLGVSTDRDGRWRVTLEGGSTWTQVGYDYVNEPKVGALAVVRKVSLGGYELAVPGSRPFRAVRGR